MRRVTPALLQRGMLVGLALAMVLVLIARTRYPGNPATAPHYGAEAGIALLLLLAIGGGVGVWGTRARPPESGAMLRRGALVGVGLGLLWVIEIGFNNFVSPRLATGQARFVIDNGIWGATALLTVALSAGTAFRTQRIASGMQVGFWSGLVSGLMACLMGLLLVTLWMPFVLRDPLNIAEWATRGAASGASDIATYFAYETMAGAIGHLVLLGMVLGTLLGAVGGVIGSGVRTVINDNSQ